MVVSEREQEVRGLRGTFWFDRTFLRYLESAVDESREQDGSSIG